jgi:hypothetical protein
MPATRRRNYVRFLFLVTLVGNFILSVWFMTFSRIVRVEKATVAELASRTHGPSDLSRLTHYMLYDYYHAEQLVISQQANELITLERRRPGPGLIRQVRIVDQDALVEVAQLPADKHESDVYSGGGVRLVFFASVASETATVYAIRDGNSVYFIPDCMERGTD